MPLPAVATLLRAAQILLGRRCCFQRWQRFYPPPKSCSVAGAASSACGAPMRRSELADAGAASSGGDASTRRSNPALTQVPLQAAATLLRAAQILIGRKCRFKWPRRFDAPMKSCSDAGAASSGGDALPLKSSGHDASTRRSNPAQTQLLLPTVTTLLRAVQILRGRRYRFTRPRRVYAPLKSSSDHHWGLSCCCTTDHPLFISECQERSSVPCASRPFLSLTLIS